MHSGVLNCDLLIIYYNKKESYKSLEYFKDPATFESAQTADICTRPRT